MLITAFCISKPAMKENMKASADFSLAGSKLLDVSAIGPSISGSIFSAGIFVYVILPLMCKTTVFEYREYPKVQCP